MKLLQFIFIFLTCLAAFTTANGTDWDGVKTKIETLGRCAAVDPSAASFIYCLIDPLKAAEFLIPPTMAAKFEVYQYALELFHGDNLVKQITDTDIDKLKAIIQTPGMWEQSRQMIFQNVCRPLVFLVCRVRVNEFNVIKPWLATTKLPPVRLGEAPGVGKLLRHITIVYLSPLLHKKRIFAFNDAVINLLHYLAKRAQIDPSITPESRLSFFALKLAILVLTRITSNKHTYALINRFELDQDEENQYSESISDTITEIDQLNRLKTSVSALLQVFRAKADPLNGLKLGQPIRNIRLLSARLFSTQKDKLSKIDNFMKNFNMRADSILIPWMNNARDRR